MKSTFFSLSTSEKLVFCETLNTRQLEIEGIDVGRGVPPHVLGAFGALPWGEYMILELSSVANGSNLLSCSVLLFLNQVHTRQK